MKTTVEQRYEQYVEDMSSTQWECPHEDDMDNVPMTFEEFVAYEEEVEQSLADDGPYGRIV